MKKFLLLLIPICCIAAKSFAQPANNPASLTPLAPSQVISIYTDNFYADLTGVNFNPNWGQSGFATATVFTLDGNNMRHYPNMNYQGIDLRNGVNPPQNISSLETLHLDIWTTNVTSLDIFLVADNGTERAIRRSLTLNEWNRLQIPLSEYAAIGLPLAAIKEFKFVTITPGSGANIFVDNIFFFTTATLPTLSNFSIPSKTVGDAPFAITPPTSNSAGAFSYTSSNESVATISGDIITVVGGGTSIITATQAADGSFGAGSITANFIVKVPPPNVAAPNPPGRAASDVVSLFSDAFTSAATLSVAEWSPAGNTVQVVSAAGNDALELQTSGGPFTGFNLSNAIDLREMTFLHFDIWIAGTSQIGAVFNTTVSQHNGGHLTGQTTGYVHTIELAQGQEGKWLSFDIPFSSFAPSLAAGDKNIVSQMVFTHVNSSSGGPIYMDNIYFYREGPLPVKWTSFTAAVKANTVVLNWETATEVNNRGFAVERSKDGRAWSDLTFVNTTAPNGGGSTYTSVDFSPLQGMNFYRLRQMDLDGKFSFSQVRQVNFNGNADAISVYPNPAKGTVNVLVDPTSKKVNYNITNAMGRSLKSGILLSEGNVNKLNLQGLPAGVYMLQVTDEKGTKTTRLVVQ